jgi:soluble lytic murein transglycosylase-like protein
MSAIRRTRFRIATVLGLLALSPSGARAQASSIARATTALDRVAAARNARKMSARFDPAFKKYSKRYFGPAFDWRLFKAQGFAESGLKPGATSWVGARGVMQLMPSTYREIASHRPEFGPIDQPEWNIAAGIMHDRYLWQLWQREVPDDERHRFMFGSYNAGEGTIARALTVARTRGGAPAWSTIEQVAPSVQHWRYTETLGYVRRIDSTYAWLSRPF